MEKTGRSQFGMRRNQHYRIRNGEFQRIFDQDAKQETIFENIAKPVAESVLAGYNGTIFAYGQTGSGKTFTITGGAERYSDRGIIPRTLSYIFEQVQKDSSKMYTTHISYLEIYNECGYDLLDPRHEASSLEDLPKVTVLEDPDQNIHLKNLSLHQATTEEEALNLLFLGDTNRMIAETPMNQASTRSHCIFTVHLSSKEPGSATVRHAKLHLVDLAGSERVAKTGVGGQLLTEAKYINLSLHYLEQVIIALSEKHRAHVPYRNSMMTSVLRDSLGGNCMTTMVATLSLEKRNIDESISTCRFAQRVALIKNEAVLNEEIDPKLMIIRLQKEIQELRDELAIVTGEQRTEALTEAELLQRQGRVAAFHEKLHKAGSVFAASALRKKRTERGENGSILLMPAEEKGSCDSHTIFKRIRHTLCELWISDLKGIPETSFVLNSILLQAPIYPMPNNKEHRYPPLLQSLTQDWLPKRRARSLGNASSQLGVTRNMRTASMEKDKTSVYSAEASRTKQQEWLLAFHPRSNRRTERS
ncbi:PREDICTED: kinesin-like protein KIF6 [Capra hircus]|uniref:kinesin-like protein KIF6 n=1 Tax=Capra hircus TaxID=9925 RepID=UPI00084642A7|nr:PREDICTED: kinesin-like protein KIF6 [Capra hircus]